jgi:molecular chaperone HscA
VPIQIQEPQEKKSQNSLGICPIEAVGIDLGTTHTLVAYGEEGEVHMLSFNGDPLVPSLWGLEGGKMVCGREAQELQWRFPEKVVASIKRLMGRGLQDEVARSFPHPLRELPGEGLALEMEGRFWTPLHISTALLKYVFDGLENTLGYPVSKAVITVPASFDEAARQATRQAALEAGFTVLRLLNEPTAAALAYGLEKGLEGLYGVFDLGGGTFDFSLLHLDKGVFQVRATGGDLTLGGDDFDRLIAIYGWGEMFETLSPTERALALEEARLLKERLSTQKEVVFQKQGGILTRDTFEALARPLVDQMFAYVQRVLQEQEVSPSDLQGLLLVGGATRMPLIFERAKAFRGGKDPLCSLDPDQVVAQGAALQAEALTYGAKHLLLDVTPLSLGLEIMGGQIDVLIRRNTRIPVAMTQTFTTSDDGQTGLQLHILQGEGQRVEDCRSLAYFELWGIPPLPAGQARVDVTFLVDADGLLTVRSQEKTTGVRQEVEVKPSYGLTPEIIRDMVLEA